MTNLAALLFDVARRLPDRPAVSDDRSSRTYPELAERVARLAGGLREQGLAPGDWVLLSLENCGEFVELLFGCWTAGLCAVPANARLHPREVEFIACFRLRHCRTQWLCPAHRGGRAGACRYRARSGGLTPGP